MCLGDVARPMLPRTAEAKQLDLVSTSHFVAKVQYLGACTHVASRLAWSGYASKLICDIRTKQVEPIAMYVYMLSDVTDMAMSVQLGSRNATTTNFQKQTQKELCKVLQSELILGFFIRDNAPGAKPYFDYIDIPNTLQNADRGTAETLRAQVEDLLNIPLMQELRALFPHVFDLVSQDLGSNNVRHENFKLEECPSAMRLAGFCLAHRFSTLQGHANKVLGDTMSGVVALAMAQRPTGCFDHLVQALTDSLRARANPLVGVPEPCESSEEYKSRHVLLNFISGCSLRPFRAKQQLLVDHYFKGSHLSEAVDIYLPMGLSIHDVDLIVENWSKEAAFALLPHATAMFARHRWCTSADTVAGVTLLALLNNTLADVGPRWMSRMGVTYDAAGSWDDDAGIDDALLLDQSGVKSEEFWQAFNARNKKGAFEFVVDPCTPAHLILQLATMEPLIRIFHRVLALGSVTQEEKETAKHINTGQRSYPIFDAVSGELFEPYYKSTLDICFPQDGFWDILPYASRTERNLSLAWALVAKSVGGMAYMAEWPYDAYPYRLFLLICPDEDLEVVIAKLMADCRETWCEFTTNFRARFPTAADLRGDKCRGVLFCIAAVFRIHMARTENRHAIIRRMLQERGSTWLCEFMSVAADWSLFWAQKHEHGSWEAQVRKAACEEGGRATMTAREELPPSASTKTRTPCGGAQRAFSSNWLRKDQRLLGESQQERFNRMWLDWRTCKADPTAYQHWQSIGALATESGRAGGMPFGPANRQAVSANKTHARSTSCFSLSDPSLSTQLALRFDESLDSKLNTLKKERQAEVARGRVASKMRLKTLEEWAKVTLKADSESTPSTSFTARTNASGRVCPRLGLGDVVSHMRHVVLPSLTVGKNLYEFASPNCRELILAQWSNMHRRYVHDKCRPLGKVKPRRNTKCMIAALCCCGCPSLRLVDCPWCSLLCLHNQGFVVHRSFLSITRGHTEVKEERPSQSRSFWGPSL